VKGARVARAKFPVGVAILAVLASVYFVVLKVHQYRSLGVNGELADFESILWNTLHGRFLLKGSTGACFLSEHVSPILLGLVPLYALFPSPLTLLVVQALAASLAVIPLYFLSRRELRSPWAAWAVSLAYLLDRRLNYGLMYDFHMEIFFPGLFFGAFLALEHRRWKTLYVLLLLALLVKEDAAITVAGIGLYVAATGSWRRGVPIAIGAAAFGLVAVSWIVPHFRPPGAGGTYPFLQYWSGYGDSLGSILRHGLDPRRHVRVLFTAYKLRKMLALFSSCLFLPLFSWRAALFLVGPTWFVLYSSDHPLMNGPSIYYGLAIVPCLFAASLLGMRHLADRWPRRADGLRLALAAALFAVELGNSRVFKQSRPAYWRTARRQATVERFVARIPPDAAVSAQVDLVAHVPVRADRHLIPAGLARSEFVFFDLQGNTWPLSPGENRALFDSLAASPGWRLVIEGDGLELLHRAARDTL
jgi:uncharacterized membrane protein